MRIRMLAFIPPVVLIAMLSTAPALAAEKETARVAAGPVGRRAEAATDVELAAEIYSYSRNRGLFACVSLEESALEVDDAANAAFYGREGIRGSEIFAGTGLTAPAVAIRLESALDRHASPAKKG